MELRTMKNSVITNWAAGATAVASLAWLFLSFHPFPPDIDHRLHEAVGEKMAEEAIRLRDATSRIIVLARDTSAFEVPAAEAQLESFLHRINKQGFGAPIVRLVKVDPLRAVSVPPGDFFDLLRLGSETDVLVSLLGPPMLTAEQSARLPAKRPRVVALCAGGIPLSDDLKRLFKLELLNTAVVSQPHAPARTTAKTRQGAFEEMFRLVTPANFSELAGIAGEPR